MAKRAATNAAPSPLLGESLSLADKLAARRERRDTQAMKIFTPMEQINEGSTLADDPQQAVEEGELSRFYHYSVFIFRYYLLFQDKQPWLLDEQTSGFTATHQMIGEGESTTEIVPADCDCCTITPAMIRGGVPANSQCRVAPCVIKTFKYIQAQQIAQLDSVAKLETTVKRLQATVTSVRELEPEATTGLSCPIRFTSVREEVSKWLLESKGTDTSV